jgi:hypothetical protein
MRSFGRRVDGLEGRRKALREEVVLAASAMSLQSSTAVVVTDVSSKGAKLIGRELPSRGAHVLVTVGEVELFATVVWSGANNECGVTFDAPLDAELVDQIKREGRWSKVMGVPTHD